MDQRASDLISKLATAHHARAAYRQLLALGLSALPDVRASLTHPSPAVRYWCCQFLDHFATSEALDALFDMVDDPSPEVRGAALHALVCDRCKAGSCRPDAARTFALALERLRSDEDAHVRAFALEAVGEVVHERREALAAVLEAASADPSPTVRKKARWYAPGGAVYERRRTKTGRLRPVAA